MFPCGVSSISERWVAPSCALSSDLAMLPSARCSTLNVSVATRVPFRYTPKLPESTIWPVGVLPATAYETTTTMTIAAKRNFIGPPGLSDSTATLLQSPGPLRAASCRQSAQPNRQCGNTANAPRRAALPDRDLAAEDGSRERKRNDAAPLRGQRPDAPRRRNCRGESAGSFPARRRRHP